MRASSEQKEQHLLWDTTRTCYAEVIPLNKIKRDYHHSELNLDQRIWSYFTTSYNRDSHTVGQIAKGCGINIKYNDLEDVNRKKILEAIDRNPRLFVKTVNGVDRFLRNDERAKYLADGYEKLIHVVYEELVKLIRAQNPKMLPSVRNISKSVTQRLDGTKKEKIDKCLKYIVEAGFIATSTKGYIVVGKPLGEIELARIGAYLERGVIPITQEKIMNKEIIYDEEGFIIMDSKISNTHFIVDDVKAEIKEVDVAKIIMQIEEPVLATREGKRFPYEDIEW